jgi:type I restriction enzyme S subunit
MKCPAYPKYKESGVEWLGQVPGHWEVKRGRFAMMVNPASPVLRALEGDDEVSFLPMDAVGEFGGLRLEQTRAIAEAGGGYTEFQDGDVVLAKITPCFENCKGALATGLVNGAAYGTTELHVLRSGPHLDTRYLFYLTITDGFRKFGEAEMYGAGGQKRVPPEFCKDFPTPLPPSAEQAAIADFLDRETGRIDTLVTKKRKLIELLKEKRSALISRTVTRGLPAAIVREFGLRPHTRFKHSGIEWLGEVPVEWEIKKLRFLCTIETGDKDTVNAEDDGKYPFFVRSQIVERINSYTKNCEGVLTAGDGVGVGKVFHYVNGKFDFHQRVYLFSQFKSVRGKYFFLYLKEFFWRVAFDGGAKSTVDSLRRPMIANFPVVVPPIDEQTAIATFLDRETAKIDRLTAKVEAAIVRLQEYRTALITAAVTGKIDVRQEAL